MEVALVATVIPETIFLLITSIKIAIYGLYIKRRYFALGLRCIGIVGLDEVWDSHELGLGGDVVSVAGLD